MFSRRIVIALLITCGGIPTIAAELRTWTDSTGKYKTEAEFVKFEDDQVTLRQGEKTVTLAFDRLSDADQAYVEDLLDSLEDEDRREPTQPGQKKRDLEPSRAKSEDTSARRGVASISAERRVRNVVNSVRNAVYRDQTLKKLRQIGLAVMSYESTKQRFPTAAILDREKKPLLSWRVAILPMLEEQSLYRQFKLNEPWDSEHNKALITKMPSVFQSPGSNLEDGYTNYLAITGLSTVISSGAKGTRIRDIRDGTTNTLMVVEADDTFGAVWTKPDDYEWDTSQPLQGLGNIWPSQFFGIFADGRASRMSTSLELSTLNALVTTKGGERIRKDEL